MIRVFENQQFNLHTAVVDKTLYFKAKEVALALGYEKPKDAIKAHVPEEYEKSWADIREVIHSPCTNSSRASRNEGQHPQSVYMTEPGLYALIFRSNLPAADAFRKWVFEEVLPAIRKTGQFKAYNKQMFKIENEFHLHRKVVDYVRRFYPDLLFVAGLGELQDTSDKRIKSWQKGYQKGQPDLIITSHHKRYNGFCLEFKTPTGRGVLSEAQDQLLKKYADNGFKTLVSSDYDVIIREITAYCQGLRIPCQYCPQKFKTPGSIGSHLRGFHKISHGYND